MVETTNVVAGTISNTPTYEQILKFVVDAPMKGTSRPKCYGLSPRGARPQAGDRADDVDGRGADGV